MSRAAGEHNLSDFFRELERRARELAMRTIRLTTRPDRLLGLCLLDGRVGEVELAALLPQWARPAAGEDNPAAPAGPASRAQLLEELARELALVAKSRLPCALLLAAIDPLATIIAAHGPDNGEQLIAQVGQRLALHLHPQETLSHYRAGKEEEGSGFAIILPGASLRKASQRAEKLRLSIKETPLYVAGTSYQLTLSIGAGSCHADEELSPGSFLDRVQRQLQRASGKGDRVAQEAPSPRENPCQVTVEERAQLFGCFAP